MKLHHAAVFPDSGVQKSPWAQELPDSCQFSAWSVEDPTNSSKMNLVCLTAGVTMITDVCSHLFAALMPSLIRHGPTIPRRTEGPPPEMGPSSFSVASSRESVASRNKSVLRTPVQRPPHEVARRESHRMSAPPYLPRSLGDLPHEYRGSSQSFLTDVSPMSENGDAARYYYPSEPYYENQQQRQPKRVQECFPEDYRYYEHNEHNFQRVPRQHTPPAPSRPPSGEHYLDLLPFFPCFSFSLGASCLKRLINLTDFCCTPCCNKWSLLHFCSSSYVLHRMNEVTAHHFRRFRFYS